MGKSKKLGVFLLILCFVLPAMASLVDGKNHESNHATPRVFAHQLSGTQFLDVLDLNGSSNIPLSESRWTLHNASSNEEIPVLLTSGFLTNVEPHMDSTWDWDVQVNVSRVICTCHFKISKMNSTEPPLLSIVVYLGEPSSVMGGDHQDATTATALLHRPVLSKFETNRIFLTDDSVQVKIPAIFVQNSSADSQLQIDICSAPFGVCLESFVAFEGYSQITNSDGVFMEINSNSTSIHDGIWLFHIRVLDSLLRISEVRPLIVHIDRTLPNVSLVYQSASGSETESSLSNETYPAVIEGTTVLFSATVEDGYLGGVIDLTWSVVYPDLTRHSITESEQLSDTEISLQPMLSGTWSVELLVRDSVGRLVRTTSEFSVVNRVPIPSIQLDGLTITEGSTITSGIGNEWDLNCDDSSDTANDDSGLMCTWYVNGQTYVSGKSALNQSDFEDSGSYDIRMVVTDDDGESSEIQFTLLLEDTENNSANSGNLIGTVSILFIIFFGSSILFMRRNKNRTSLNRIPKWNHTESSSSTDDLSDEF